MVTADYGGRGYAGGQAASHGRGHTNSQEQRPEREVTGGNHQTASPTVVPVALSASASAPVVAEVGQESLANQKSEMQVAGEGVVAPGITKGKGKPMLDKRPCKYRVHYGD